MRRFSAEYLDRTREGMWADSRAALADLALDSRERVLDAGCGTGELSRVLAEETAGEVIGVDADPALLTHVRDQAANEDPVPVVAGDATRLPFRDDAFDLVVCQALLINLPDPAAAIREFARVSSDLVAAVEPDNGDVTVTSTVTTEAALDQRAREAYIDGVATDVTLGGPRTHELFEAVGLTGIETRAYHHGRTVEPPYSQTALEDARRKATGSALADRRRTMTAGACSDEEFERLREEWRAMGRTVIEQMSDREYRREEVIPFYVTVGRV